MHKLLSSVLLMEALKTVPPSRTTDGQLSMVPPTNGFWATLLHQRQVQNVHTYQWIRQVQALHITGTLLPLCIFTGTLLFLQEIILTCPSTGREQVKAHGMKSWFQQC